MKLGPFCFFIIMLINTTDAFLQGNASVKFPDSLSPWEKKNVVRFDLSEIAFSNWNAGGVSSISGLLKGEFYPNLYSTKK